MLGSLHLLVPNVSKGCVGHEAHNACLPPLEASKGGMTQNPEIPYCGLVNDRHLLSDTQQLQGVALTVAEKPRKALFEVFARLTAATVERPTPVVIFNTFGLCRQPGPRLGPSTL